jgi:methionyl-tRNA formyltransferase
MGTAPLAATILRALLADPRLQIRAVVSQPDKPKGRDLKVQFTAVKEVAVDAGLPVLQPLKARDPGFIAELATFHPELGVVAAYGQILPTSLLDLPRLGCLNVHTSLLPRYRGAAPIQWAILDGLAETGVTIMKMDAGLDTGPMIATATTPIGPDDTSATLHDRLAELGARLLVDTIPAYADGRLTPVPQPAEGASYARKITKEDGQLHWSEPASVLWHRVRGLNPWPTAQALLPGDGAPQAIKIWKATPLEETAPAQPGTIVAARRDGIDVACGSGQLRILELQREGRRRMTAAEFLAGCPLAPGTRFATA